MMKKLDKKIGLAGAGNMGSAVFEGLLRKSMISAAQVWVYDTLTDRKESFAREWKAKTAQSIPELAGKTRLILLAFKPQDLPASAADFKRGLTESHTVISILAGISIEVLRKQLGDKPRIVRAMPNLGAKVGAGITAVTGGDQQSLEEAEFIFSGCGLTLRLEEAYFDCVTALSGSGPAYYFLLMEMMAAEGVRAGLTPAQAKMLAVQTAAGAGLLAASSSEEPAVLREKVTSKGGTTEAALGVLEQAKIRDIFHSAIQAAVERGRKLGGR